MKTKTSFRTSAGVVLIMLIILIVALTLLGTLDTLDSPVRGALLAAAAIASAYLGSQLQKRDDSITVEAVSGVAYAGLVALAKSVRGVIDTTAQYRRSVETSPPKDVEHAIALANTMLSGLDGHIDAIRYQVTAAGEVWRPWLKEERIQDPSVDGGDS